MPESDLKDPAIQTVMQTALADLNRTVHEPARLAILTVLAACTTADFTFLQTATGLSRGNLSVQLTRLEAAGLVTIEKTIEQKRTLTMVALAKEGRYELSRYWTQMEQIRSHATARLEPGKSKPRTSKQGREVPGRFSPLSVA